ncbi:hypothetical protein TWF281_005177 [Arthrobotrys megalospora]
MGPLDEAVVVIRVDVGGSGVVDISELDDNATSEVALEALSDVEDDDVATVVEISDDSEVVSTDWTVSVDRAVDNWLFKVVIAASDVLTGSVTADESENEALVVVEGLDTGVEEEELPGGMSVDREVLNNKVVDDSEEIIVEDDPVDGTLGGKVLDGMLVDSDVVSELLKREMVVANDALADEDKVVTAMIDNELADDVVVNEDGAVEDKLNDGIIVVNEDDERLGASVVVTTEDGADEEALNVGIMVENRDEKDDDMLDPEIVVGSEDVVDVEALNLGVAVVNVVSGDDVDENATEEALDIGIVVGNKEATDEDVFSAGIEVKIEGTLNEDSVGSATADVGAVELDEGMVVKRVPEEFEVGVDNVVENSVPDGEELELGDGELEATIEDGSVDEGLREFDDATDGPPVVEGPTVPEGNSVDAAGSLEVEPKEVAEQPSPAAAISTTLALMFRWINNEGILR